jgi:hypothetical protein
MIDKGLNARESTAVRWNKSTFYNMTILGLCNLAAPGIWGAMNSLGAGGAAKPYLVNTANALTFCLMVVSCYFSGVLVYYIGIKGALIFGTYVSFLPFLTIFFSLFHLIIFPSPSSPTPDMDGIWSMRINALSV